jgi:hypothetical protein
LDADQQAQRITSNKITELQLRMNYAKRVGEGYLCHKYNSLAATWELFWEGRALLDMQL